MSRSIRTTLAVTALVIVGLAACSDDSTATPESRPSTATTVAAPAASSADPYGASDGSAAQVSGSVSVEIGDTPFGEALTSDGYTLYIFTPDEGGTPTCLDACADLWPPLLGASAGPAEGLGASELTTVARPDGTSQLAYHGWPLYRYAPDAAPGDVTGQGVGGNWWVIGPDGTPITS